VHRRLTSGLRWIFKWRTQQYSDENTISECTSDSSLISNIMQSVLETLESQYLGPRTSKWSPTSLFPRAGPLDRNTFPPHTPQPYLGLINRLSQKGHPDLNFLSSEFQRQKGGLHAERSRAAVLEYTTAGVPPKSVQFPTSKDLEMYLTEASRSSCNRLYILEDISANYVEAFGSRFSIEPSFWALHLRTTDIS
jgi:hypothetical protein